MNNDENISSSGFTVWQTVWQRHFKQAKVQLLAARAGLVAELGDLRKATTFEVASLEADSAVRKNGLVKRCENHLESGNLCKKCGKKCKHHFASWELFNNTLFYLVNDSFCFGTKTACSEIFSQIVDGALVMDAIAQLPENTIFKYRLRIGRPDGQLILSGLAWLST